MRASALKLGRDPEESAKARRRITFASAMVNVPPGTTDTFKVPLTKKARNFVKKTNAKRLKSGRLEVRDISGAIVSNPPMTIRLARSPRVHGRAGRGRPYAW